MYMTRDAMVSVWLGRQTPVRGLEEKPTVVSSHKGVPI